MTTFDSFKIPAFLCASLKKMHISVPTPIQEKAIPAGLERQDVLASAQTGTGKTIAYLIPLLANLVEDKTSSALILAPTRDLAMQIQDTARRLLGKEIEIALIIGGTPMNKQLIALKRRPRLIIGTPGRVNDHLARKSLRLQETKYLVLDEADRMLDMGFSQALDKIVPHLPKERQTFMFSATLPPSIQKMSALYLTNPTRITVGSTTEPTKKIKQETLEMATSEKLPNLLTELNNREGSILVFVKTKRGADRLAKKLASDKHSAVAVHGDLRQSKREKIIRDYRNLKTRIMVATDVAARGLDIPHIQHVINFDLPQCPEDYIHRIGRTGRAEKEGSAISFISPDESHIWRQIHRLIHKGESSPEPHSFRKKKKDGEAPKKGRKFFGKGNGSQKGKGPVKGNENGRPKAKGKGKSNAFHSTKPPHHKSRKNFRRSETRAAA